MPCLDDAYRLARWLTGSRHDAEDVVQDAFLRAFAAIDRYAGGNPRAWVLTIVRRTAYSWLARNRPKALVLCDDLEAVERANPGPIDTGEPRARETPETALLARETGARLSAAIDALPAPFREVLVLRDLQGLPYREIAEVAAIPIGTVMSRLARARGLLLEMLGDKQ